MSLINVSYPISGSFGSYNNIFPASSRLPFTMNRIDQAIATITSGSDGKVRITTTADMVDVSIGDYVSWGSSAYSSRSSRVIKVNNIRDIEVDEIFTSSVATNGHINYKKDWILEIRYVRKDETFGNQNAVSLFPFVSQIPSTNSGQVTANISLPSEDLIPEFEAASGIETNLFQEYKIQYRESWKDNRDESWVSPEPDIPVMLVHGSDALPFNDFTDPDVPKRFVRGYPLFYTYIYSSVNDGVSNQVTIRQVQYNLRKEAIATDDILVIPNANGVYMITADTNTFDSECVFVLFQASKITDVGQYDGEDYDGDQYKTIGEGGEGFPYTFPVELS